MEFLLKFLFFSIFFQAFKCHVLELSPGNGTIVKVGSNQTYTCTIKPCNDTFSVLLQFGSVQKLFSGTCNENYTVRDRVHFSCYSDECTYSFQVFGIKITDHYQVAKCGYRSSDSKLIQQTTIIEVIQKPTSLPIIEPEGPFHLGKTVNMTCTIHGGYPSPSICFSCNSRCSQAKTVSNDSITTSLIVKMDSNMVGSLCKCIVIQRYKTFRHQWKLEVMPEIYSDSTIISPRGPFMDGSKVKFKCSFSGQNRIYNISLTFECHGKQDNDTFFDNIVSVSFDVLISLDFNGSLCTCYDSTSRRDIRSNITLRILPYDPQFDVNQITIDNTSNLTCTVPNLLHPFGFGPWIYFEQRDQQYSQKIINATTSVLLVENATYENVGIYYCTVVDKRINSSIVANASIQLKVPGPILLEDLQVDNTNTSHCNFKVKFKSYPMVSVQSLWKDNKQIILKETDMSTTSVKESIEHWITLQLESCLEKVTYGMIASNSIYTKNLYFDLNGVIFDQSPMVRMDGTLTDGNRASVSCFDITQNEVNDLELSCDNVSIISTEEQINAALVKSFFVADIVNNQSRCQCSSNTTGETATVRLLINSYENQNMSMANEKCESNSQIFLPCIDKNLPEYYAFGDWIHHFNGVQVRQLEGSRNHRQTSLRIPFCTYEDIGNYTCTVVDTRKNTSLYNSTVYLSVPVPPVIINSSIDRLQKDEGCLLNVNFYSFSNTKKLTWLKNGKKLHSSEYQKQSFSEFIYVTRMHDTSVPVNSKTATLHIKPICDVDQSKYSFTVRDSEGYEAYYTFEEDDVTVRKLIIILMTVATGIFMAGLNITICRSVKGAKGRFKFLDVLSKSKYSWVKAGRRITQFYEEIDMVIENLRQADEADTRPNRDSLDSNYEQIPADHIC